MYAFMTLLFLAPQAWATDLRSATIPWSELGLSPARPEAQARGPELLRAGEGERLAMYDSVRREVVLLEGERVALSFPVRHASDLALLDDGLLVLDHAARELGLWSLDGELLAAQGLPELAPTSLGLDIEGGQVYGRDVFGNRHPVATCGAGDLGPPRARGLRTMPSEVFWDGEAMSTDGLRLQLPHAIKASGQRFGDWLVVDIVVADRPIEVERKAWHVPTGQAVELPVEGRLYAPRGDAAATPGGELVVIAPREEGLEILRVSP